MIRSFNRLFILSICLLMLMSCVSNEVKLSKIKNELETINSHAWYKGCFYLGSDEHFHYFSVKWDYQLDKKYKLPKQELQITEEIPLGKNEILLTHYKNWAIEKLQSPKPLSPIFSVGGVNYYGIPKNQTK